MKKIVILILGVCVLLLASDFVSNQVGRIIDVISGKPQIVKTEPEPKATEIAQDAKIKIKFNKDIDQKTLNNRSISISYLNADLKFFINPFLGSHFDYDKETKTLIITPPNKFLPNQQIEVRLSNLIKSVDGKELARSGQKTDSEETRYVLRFKTKAD